MSIHVPKTPTDDQRLACDEVVRRILDEKRKGQILLGGTGAGKTPCAVWIAQDLVKKLDNGSKIIWCVVPSMGTVVFNQWYAELADQRSAEYSMIYHGPKRTQQLKAFHERFELDSDSSRAWFVITSIDTLHADVNKLLYSNAPAAAAAGGAVAARKRIKDFSVTEVHTARRAAMNALGRVDFVTIDEFQVFGNGSPPTDASRDIDLTKTFYLTLNEFIKRSNPIAILGLTATPCRSTSGEVFSFLRFILDNRFSKSAFVQQTKDKAVTTLICQQFVVKVPAQPVPATTYHTISHGLTECEAALHRGVYETLFVITDLFLKAIIKWSEQKNNPFLASEKERLKRSFLLYLTRARRMVVHPALAEPCKRADPTEHPARNAAGELLYGFDEGGERVVLGKPLPIDVSAIKCQWPLSKCSKMMAIFDKLETVTNERTVVQMTYSDPCDLFEAYFKDRFPGREIYVYHGGRPRRAATMEAFKHGAANAVLVATRGSCEMAVNIETTTMGSEWDEKTLAYVPRRLAARQIFVDLPLSQAEQTQAEGRTKRPNAQGYPNDDDRVMHWHAETARCDHTGATIEDFLEKSMSIKEARCNDLFRDPEAPDVVADAASSAQTDSESTGVLRALLTTLAEYRPPPGARKKRQRGGPDAESGAAAPKAMRSAPPPHPV